MDNGRSENAGSEKKLVSGGWVDGWMDGWMGTKAGLMDCLSQTKDKQKTQFRLIIDWTLGS